MIFVFAKYHLARKNKAKTVYAIKLSLKVLFYPLMLCSIHTIISMIYAQVFTLLGLVSLIVSVSLFASLSYTMLLVRLKFRDASSETPTNAQQSIKIEDL